MANQILLVTDDRRRSADVPPLLSGHFACDVVDLDMAERQLSQGHAAVLFDVDLSDRQTAQKLAVLARARRDKTPRIFLTSGFSYHARVQAAAFNGAAVIDRPIKLPKLMLAIFGPSSEHAPVPVTAEVAAAAKAAVGTMTHMFDALKRDAPLDLSAMTANGEQIEQAVMRGEVTQWVSAVREHHSYTYRHCMLVAGVTASFANYLGIGAPCRARLMRAALLHDIGKAHIPAAILDKPEKLNEAELKIMRGHPGYGRNFLRKHHGTEAEVIDIVYRHHEMLDGSGYPEGLKADGISDVVRLITICDIYAALIEPRPYKKTCTKEEAFAIMEGMGGKLDAQLLSAFRGVALA
jgi:putative nucleotidyltransferase with HDIG domain